MRATTNRCHTDEGNAYPNRLTEWIALNVSDLAHWQEGGGRRCWLSSSPPPVSNFTVGEAG